MLLIKKFAYFIPLSLTGANKNSIKAQSVANQTVKVRLKSNGVTIRTITKRAYDLMKDKYELLNGNQIQSELKKSPLDNEGAAAVPVKRGRGRPPKNEA